MATVEIRIPQLGEGLVEVRIVRLLKKPGDPVQRDEAIYTMETDKAEVDIESPVTGTLVSWAVAEDDIVPIGEVAGRIDSPEAHPPAPEPAFPQDEPGRSAVHETPAQRRGLRNANIPPRTRAYAKRLGLSGDELPDIPAAGRRLMPADIDRYLGGKREAAEMAEPQYEDVPMSARQRTLFYRLTSSASQVIPGTIEEAVPWDPVEQVNDALKAAWPEDRPRPSRFLLVAWCVARALERHEAFRSSIVDVNTLRRFTHGNLGIAVALPQDELASAVVPRAGARPFEDFIETARLAIQEAREGVDQAAQTPIHVSLTGMTAYGVRTAVPVVVPPSVATLFVGAPYDAPRRGEQGGVELIRVVHLVLTFDHRVINGVGAAAFLSDVRDLLAALPEDFGTP